MILGIPASIKIRKLDGENATIELSGEFDIRALRALGATLGTALASGRRTRVDLYRVTFLDGLCTRELAILYWLYPHRLVLCDPSHEVELSVAACDMEDLVKFRRTRGAAGRHENGACSNRFEHERSRRRAILRARPCPTAEPGRGGSSGAGLCGPGHAGSERLLLKEPSARSSAVDGTRA